MKIYIFYRILMVFSLNSGLIRTQSTQRTL